ncbi:hypothetical protein FVE85_5590 [Porphyridium purpureum]|uniref:SP-RING-type domain-containing protein n=1 Tax=Porphyridium purpureum TaxID=35688 RepID=A0A5J4Z3V5_PORPP|nr:hypothetical protein FVE85_5590 [Porphyridium purpureum]|eukprot:POR8390..scf295_1
MSTEMWTVEEGQGSKERVMSESIGAQLEAWKSMRTLSSSCAEQLVRYAEILDTPAGQQHVDGIALRDGAAELEAAMRVCIELRAEAEMRHAVLRHTEDEMQRCVQAAAVRPVARADGASAAASRPAAAADSGENDSVAIISNTFHSELQSGKLLLDKVDVKADKAYVRLQRRLANRSNAADADLQMAEGQSSLPFTKCPITQGPLDDAVQNIECGHYYSRDGIMAHVRSAAREARDPLCVWAGCNKKIEIDNLEPAHRVMRELRIQAGLRETVNQRQDEFSKQDTDEEIQL